MANTLTSLIPDVYAALDVVSRELVGIIPSIGRNSSADRIAKGQTLRSFATPKNAAGENITPAMSIPAAADQTIANKPLTIDTYRDFPFSWSGEEHYAMNTGPGYLNIRQDQIAQAFRSAINEMELSLAQKIALGASRAYGTANTTPFSTNTGEAAQIKKILDDNGAPISGRSLIIDTTTGAQLRTLTQLTKANEAGTTMTLRDGEILNLSGLSIKESAQVQPVTIGTASGATSTSAAFTVGQTTIPIATAGTGLIIAGDVITFANDTNKYVVASATFAGANPAAGDSIVLAAPGLLKAQGIATRAITVVGTSTLLSRCIAFSQNAAVLATRLPVLPPEGDLAISREIIQDPRTGIAFELAVYPGYRMNRYELAIAYGSLVVKPEHAALLVY